MLGCVWCTLIFTSYTLEMHVKSTHAYSTYSFYLRRRDVIQCDYESILKYFRREV